MKQIRYFFEALFVNILFLAFRLMPLDMASACGGWIGCNVGPRLAVSRKALDNLRRALPGRTDEEYSIILAGMYDNLGRVIAEYPHLEKIARTRVDIINRDLIARPLAEGKTIVLVSGHLANWETAATTALFQMNLPLKVVYRAPNNPWVADLLDRARSFNGRISTIPKSKTGMRALLESLKKGDHIGILIDQKYNEGIPASFFGQPAMTSPAFVHLAQKFKCPLIAARVERLKGAHFRITAFEPATLYNADGTPRAVADVIEDTHRVFESWIRERPEQWLWLHRRWMSEADITAHT